MADSVPGKKGRCMADSVHLGSESIDEDSIERYMYTDHMVV